MDSQQQREALFRRDPADELRDAAAPQHPRPAQAGRDRHPLLLPGHPLGHAGVVQGDAMFRHPSQLPVENLNIAAAQARPQDLQDVDMGHYDMANDYPPPQGRLGGNARCVRDPAQVHDAPPAPVGAFDFQAPPAVAGPAPAFFAELPVPNQVPVPNGRVIELLRQRATRYLDDPNSIVAGVSIEPGQADELMVVIAARLNVPARVHDAPLAPDIGAFDFQALPAAAGPAPAFFAELPVPNQVPVPNGRASELLRQLATRYLHDRHSIVAGISMEPGQADELMVITVRLTNL